MPVFTPPDRLSRQMSITKGDLMCQYQGLMWYIRHTCLSSNCQHSDALILK